MKTFSGTGSLYYLGRIISEYGGKIISREDKDECHQKI